jgi:hypothetical protein
VVVVGVVSVTMDVVGLRVVDEIDSTGSTFVVLDGSGNEGG